MKYWRISVVGFVLLLALVAAFFLRNPAEPPVKKAAPKPADPAHFAAKDVSVSLLDRKDVVRWELKIARVKEDRGGMNLFDVRGRYFPELGAPFSLQAKTGRMSERMDRLLLDNGVVLAREGYSLEGQKLTWEAETGGFRMTGRVVLETSALHGEGETLTTDSTLKWAHFEGQCLWRTKTSSSAAKGGRKD